MNGGFFVDDGRTRRLEQHARQLGFHDLRSYLQIRCDTGHSVPGLAHELGVSEWTVTQALGALGIVLPPRPERLARQRRRHAEERIARRVAVAEWGRRVQSVSWQARRAERLAELGFADLAAYLECRHVEQSWSLKWMRTELRVGRRWLVKEMTRLGIQP